MKLRVIQGGNTSPKRKVRRPYDRTTRRLKMFDGREIFVPVIPDGAA